MKQAVVTNPEVLAIIEEVKRLNQNDKFGHVGLKSRAEQKRLLCTYAEIEPEEQINTASLHCKFRQNHFLSGERVA